MTTAAVPAIGRSSRTASQSSFGLIDRGISPEKVKVGRFATLTPSISSRCSRRLSNKRLVCLRRAEAARIRDHLPRRCQHLRPVRQLGGRRIQIAAENRAARRRERLKVGRHLARALGGDASAMQMREADGQFSAAEFHSRDDSRRRADARPVPLAAQHARRARIVHRDRGHVIERHALRIALPIYPTTSPRGFVTPNSRTYAQLIPSIAPISAATSRPADGLRSRIHLAQQDHIRALERGTLETLHDFAELLTAGGVEQHDPQPRFRRGAPHDSPRLADKAASALRQPR